LIFILRFAFTGLVAIVITPFASVKTNFSRLSYL
jgi:hypothetical protein